MLYVFCLFGGEKINFISVLVANYIPLIKGLRAANTDISMFAANYFPIGSASLLNFMNRGF